MQLSPKQIRNFKSLYKEHFSVDLSDDEAVEKGSQLVMILRKVYKPILKNEYEKNDESTIT